jgi:hypothetical protein
VLDRREGYVHGKKITTEGYEVHKEKDKKSALLRATAYPQEYSKLKDLEAI